MRWAALLLTWLVLACGEAFGDQQEPGLLRPQGSVPVHRYADVVGHEFCVRHRECVEHPIEYRECIQIFVDDQQRFIDAKRAAYDSRCAADWKARLAAATCDEWNTRTGILECAATCDVFYGDLSEGDTCERNDADPECGKGLVCREGECEYFCGELPDVVIRSTGGPSVRLPAGLL